MTSVGPTTSITERSTVAEVRSFLRREYTKPDGAICPCCQRKVKLYARTINAKMAIWLIWLVRVYESSPRTERSLWIHVRKSSNVRGGDYGKLRYWGLVQNKEKTDDGKDTKNSGLWRPTSLGIDFVHNRARVPSRVYTYNDIKRGEDNSSTIDIIGALGKKFSYQELMTSAVKVDMPF